MRDWAEWHEKYDDEGSPLARRLLEVRRRIAIALDEAPPGPVRVVSICAGQGRDLLGLLPTHPRRDDVTARLVELDPRNAEVARANAGDGVEVVVGDAARTDAYAGMVPAGLVLACGIFGNVTDADIERTVSFLPQLCARGGTVIWTRHAREPDVTPAIRGWFAERGFDEASFTVLGETLLTVGAHRLARDPEPLRLGESMFAFV